jgi:hypothetical protein
MSNSENAGSAQPIACTIDATRGVTCTMSPKWRRSELARPVMKIPTVNPTDSSALDENVENNSATAVSNAISAVIITSTTSSRGSVAGAVHDSRTFSGDTQYSLARTSRAAAAHRFTAIVSTNPQYLPTMNSQRGRGFARSAKMLRRSISRATRPTPMNTVITAPASSIVARPRSLMILRSCPAVIWPINTVPATSRSANAPMA